MAMPTSCGLQTLLMDQVLSGKLAIRSDVVAEPFVILRMSQPITIKRNQSKRRLWIIRVARLISPQLATRLQSSTASEIPELNGHQVIRFRMARRTSLSWIGRIILKRLKSGISREKPKPSQMVSVTYSQERLIEIPPHLSKVSLSHQIMLRQHLTRTFDSALMTAAVGHQDLTLVTRGRMRTLKPFG